MQDLETVILAKGRPGNWAADNRESWDLEAICRGPGDGEAGNLEARDTGPEIWAADSRDDRTHWPTMVDRRTQRLMVGNQEVSQPFVWDQGAEWPTD